MLLSEFDITTAIMGSQQLHWPHTRLDLSKVSQEMGGFSCGPTHPF